MQSGISLNSRTAFTGCSCLEVILIMRHALLAEIQRKLRRQAKKEGKTTIIQYTLVLLPSTSDCQVRSHTSYSFHSTLKHGSIKRHKIFKIIKNKIFKILKGKLFKNMHGELMLTSLAVIKSFWPSVHSARLYMKTQNGCKIINRGKTAKRHQTHSL